MKEIEIIQNKRKVKVRVYESKEQAIADNNCELAHMFTPVLSFKKFGDVADGWLLLSGQRNIKEIEVIR